MEHSISPTKTTFFGGGLFLACLLLYWPSLGNGYLWHDDNLYVTENPAVVGGASLKGFKWAVTTRYQNNWMPLTWLSYQLETSFFGNSATPRHALNLILHLLNGALLMALLRRFGLSHFLAIIGGGFFLLHPACIETTAWIASRKGLLAGALGLSACLSWTHGSRWLGLLFFAASLLCKQSWVFLPLVFLALEFQRPGQERFSSKITLAGAFLLAVAGGLAAIWANSSTPDIERVTNLQPIATRITWAALAYLDQLRFALVPVNPGISHVAPHSQTIFWIIGGLAFLALITLAVRDLRKSDKLPTHFFIGLIWFSAALLPTLGLLPIGDVWRAERFLYPALPGLILMVLGLIGNLRNPIAIPVSALILAGLAFQSSQYLQHWQSSSVLFEKSYQMEPETNHVASAKLGFLAAKEGDHDSATDWFQKTLGIEPRNADALEGLAVCHARAGDTRRCRTLLDQAIALRPNRASLYFNLTLCNLNENRNDEARLTLAKALEKDPTFKPALLLRQKLSRLSR